ncbi:MAG: glycosyl hydrolase family 28 protein, partial [Planctomycetia bacterium]|nr:glycosyl hydrolase family 28 protein [Planctomycetia bacterium]
NLCRDNFIRSANCGIGISGIEPISNVHVLGVGRAELIGADDPRATGDSAKVLGERTYGTDAGREGESQRGDWRNIGVLFAWVNHFSVRNITIRDAHAWAMSFERCAFGKITDITFDASEKRLTDKNGKSFPLLNQDGLDIRQGCHDIVIDTIQGGTGDDTVALTAIRSPIREDGLLEKTEVSGPRTDGRENDIWNITIRNIVSHSRLFGSLTEMEPAFTT